MLRKRHIVALVAIAASFAVFGAAPAGANAPGITGADLGKKIADRTGRKNGLTAAQASQLGSARAALAAELGCA